MALLNYRGYGRLYRVYGRSLLRYSTPRKILNALRTEYAYRRRHSFVGSNPYILFLEPLYYCNLDCPLCDRQVFPEARKGSAGRLTPALFDRILDEIGDDLFQCQIFGQGEPLLDWPLTKQFIQRCHARRIFTLLSTNCTLLTEQIADELATSQLDYLVCAIDGITQESYAIYRVGGQVETALAGLEMVLAAKRKHRSAMSVEWQFLVHKHNAHEVEPAKALARKIGVHIRFAPLRGMEWEPEVEAQWLPTDRQALSLRHSEAPVQSAFACYFLWRSLVLNSNGKTARCLPYQNVAEYADLNGISVRDAYNDPSVQRARQLFCSHPVTPGDFPTPCRNCSYFARHHGGPALSKRLAPGVPLPVVS